MGLAWRRRVSRPHRHPRRLGGEIESPCRVRLRSLRVRACRACVRAARGPVRNFLAGARRVCAQCVGLCATSRPGCGPVCACRTPRPVDRDAYCGQIAHRVVRALAGPLCLHSPAQRCDSGCVGRAMRCAGGCGARACVRGRQLPTHVSGDRERGGHHRRPPPGSGGDSHGAALNTRSVLSAQWEASNRDATAVPIGMRVASRLP